MVTGPEWWRVLSGVVLDQGDHVRAKALYQDSLMVFREWRAKPGIAGCLEGLAGVAIAQGLWIHAATSGFPCSGG